MLMGACNCYYNIAGFIATSMWCKSCTRANYVAASSVDREIKLQVDYSQKAQSVNYVLYYVYLRIYVPYFAEYPHLDSGEHSTTTVLVS